MKRPCCWFKLIVGSRLRAGGAVLPLLFIVGCASHVPRIPGPLASMNQKVPAAHVRQLPRAERPQPTPSAPQPEQRTPKDRGFGSRLARAATHHLQHAPKGFRNDCSGFVMAAYARAGQPTTGNTRSYWDQAKQEGRTHKKKRPQPGDLVFFDNTYDRNHNGRRDDALSHVGIVLSVDADGTIEIAHGGTSKGRTTMHMNLYQPDLHTGPKGTRFNDYLRARQRGESKQAATLSGQLFRGFARPR